MSAYIVRDISCLLLELQGNADWPWRFSAAIAMYSGSNALVANNLIAKASSEAKTDVAGFKNVPFPYDNRSAAAGACLDTELTMPG